MFGHAPFWIRGEKAAWLPVWVSSMANSFYLAVNEAWPLIDGQKHLLVDPALSYNGMMGLWPNNKPPKVKRYNLNSEALRVRLLRDVEHFTPQSYGFYIKATEFLTDINLYNTDLELKNNAAYFFTENGYYGQAINILKRSFANPKICANLGILMLMVDNLTEADHYLTLALSINPDNENVKQLNTLLNWQLTDLNSLQNFKAKLAPSTYLKYWSK